MMTKQIYNFGAGPAALPTEILLEAQAELLNWQKSGVSILETGHRTVSFLALMEQAEQDLRSILNIPKNYHVIFLGMPARSQFAMIPMNFLMPEDRAGYLLSGIWSQLAYQEALRLKNAYCLATSEDSGLFLKTPCVKDFHYLDKTAYVFFTPNETIHGVSWPEVPSTAGNIPLIADMTSCLLSRPIDISQYACIFAGAQKNIAPAGLTLVIIRDDLVDRIKQNSVAAIFDYRVHIKHKPCYATPPMFSCYFAAKMFTWIKSKGGLEAFLKINNHKAKLLYDYIDDSHFYFSYIKAPYRSMQNISFHLNDSVLEKKFINQAEQAGLLALKGHKLAGGCRASLYNAMPIEGVSALIDFMEKFSALH